MICPVLQPSLPHSVDSSQPRSIHEPARVAGRVMAKKKGGLFCSVSERLAPERGSSENPLSHASGTRTIDAVPRALRRARTAPFAAVSTTLRDLAQIKDTEENAKSG